jgi:hypothetical protein
MASTPRSGKLDPAQLGRSHGRTSGQIRGDFPRQSAESLPRVEGTSLLTGYARVVPRIAVERDLGTASLLPGGTPDE